MWRIHINLTYFPQHIPVFVNAHVPLFLGVYRKIEKHNNAYIVYFVTLSFNEQNSYWPVQYCPMANTRHLPLISLP